MQNIYEILARAAALRDETQLNSISPERAGGIMYDTLLALNDLWLQQGAALVISKIYASVAAMEADTAPVSDLTGQPLRPGQIVVIASSDSDNGSVYRYNGTDSPSWSLVGEIGNLEPVDSLDSDSTQLPLAAHQGKVLDGKISQLGQYKDNSEWVYVITDNENRILFGIKADGSIEWSKGVPQPLIDYINSLLSLKVYTKSELDAPAGNAGAKVDKEIGKSLIKSAVATAIEDFHIDAGIPEYVQVDVDSNNRVLGGYSKDTGQQILPQPSNQDALLQMQLLALRNATNPLWGKKLALEGDSICAGAGADGGYGKFIGERNNMTVVNNAVSGGTITHGIKYPDTGRDRHWISSSIANMPNDADYYIIEGGVNDYANTGNQLTPVTLGELYPQYKMKGEAGDRVNYDTFIGALEYACRDLVTLFPGKKYGFVFVHKVFDDNYSSFSTWVTTWKPLMKMTLEKWGIPYIDLEEEIPTLNFIPSLKEAYTADGDGWHPNEAGYKAYYVDKIEAWMKTL